MTLFDFLIKFDANQPLVLFDASGIQILVAEHKEDIPQELNKEQVFSIKAAAFDLYASGKPRSGVYVYLWK